MAEGVDPDVQAQIVEVFKKFDHNRSGRIEGRELLVVMQHIEPEYWTKDKVEILIEDCARDLDKDHNGTVSFEEFLVWVLTPEEGETPVDGKAMTKDLKQLEKAAADADADGTFAKAEAEELAEEAAKKAEATKTEAAEASASAPPATEAQKTVEAETSAPALKEEVNKETAQAVDQDAKPKLWRLKVFLESAKDLRDADWYGTSDPYCVCMFEKHHMMHKTRTIEGTQAPEWHEYKVFRNMKEDDTMILKVSDSDGMMAGSDDSLGLAKKPLKAIIPDGFDGEIKLDDDGAKDSKATIKIRVLVEPQEAPEPDD